MVDIESAAGEIRRGTKKKEEGKKPQGKNIMSTSASHVQHVSDLHPKFALFVEVWQTSNLLPLRLGDEKKTKKEETTGHKYNGLPYSIGRP